MIRITHIFLLIIASVGHGRTPEKVVDGTNAKIRDFPYHLSIHKQGSHICGGTFIDLRHILTAAHCVLNKRNIVVNKLELFSGIDDLNTVNFVCPTEHILMVLVDEFCNMHPMNRDIAILALYKPIEISPLRKPYPITFIKEPPVGTEVLFCGWGELQHGANSASRFLQKIKLRIITIEECQTVLDLDIPSAVICTSSINGEDLSSGDSGGGLIYKGKIIGVLSSASTTEPVHVFTRVSFYRPWIQKMVEKY